MKLKNWLIPVSIGALGLASACLILTLDSDPDELEIVEVRVPVETSRIEMVQPSSKTVVHEIAEGSFHPKPSHGKPNMKSAQIASNGVENVDIDDEKLFQAVVGGLLAELRNACQKKDRSRIRELLSRLKSVTGKGYARLGNSYLLRSVKSAVLAGAGAVGPEAVEDVIDLLADTDVSVAQEAENTLFNILQDLSLGDYKRAEIVSAAAAEITDEYGISRLYSEFLRMRHSVGVAVFQEILDGGTDMAKENLPRAMSAFTGGQQITTAAELQEWLANNPDDALSDKMYGPIEVQHYEE